MATSGKIVVLAGRVVSALIALLFNGIVFRGQVLYERDIHIVWHAQVESFVRCVSSGSRPTAGSATSR